MNYFPIKLREDDYDLITKLADTMLRGRIVVNSTKPDPKYVIIECNLNLEANVNGSVVEVE